jgi:hypothetical protein
VWEVGGKTEGFLVEVSLDDGPVIASSISPATTQTNGDVPISFGVNTGTFNTVKLTPLDNGGGAPRAENTSGPDFDAVECIESGLPPAECGPSSVCIEEDGFEITLLSIADDPDAGTTSFNYQVCGGDGVNCPVPPNGLSNFRVDIPEACVTADQVSWSVDGDVLTNCGLVDNDGLPPNNQCGDPVSGNVLKCDVIPDDFGKEGECTVITLTIAGEPPVGVGTAAVGTKAGPDCQPSSIIGPACGVDQCELPPTEVEACLTRTPGFWGTHPHVTGDFLPVNVCGIGLDNVDLGDINSVTEALCVAPGKEGKSQKPRVSSQILQLYRQLAAAKLNLAATSAAGGTCDATLSEALSACGVGTLDELEYVYCEASGKEISQSGCIEALASFNESQDTLQPPPPPFDQPGPADPTDCSPAHTNGIIIK